VLGEPRMSSQPTAPKRKRKTTQSKAKKCKKPSSDSLSVFELLDLNGTGKIAANELRGIMSSLGYENKSEEIQSIITELAEGSESFVDVRKFEQAFTARLTQNDKEHEIERAFKLIDVEKRGVITLTSLSRVAQEVGEKLDEDDLREMIVVADRAKVNGVLYEDFYWIMTST